MSKFVYGDSKRIFINTFLGCRAKCKYCYLPSLGINGHNGKITADEAIEGVEKLKIYKDGKDGSIISIGCYSECMDYENINDTVQIIKYFSQKGNYIQLATKKKISENVLITLKNYLLFQHQLSIFISMPVYSQAEKIEEGTDSVKKRMETIHLCKKTGIDVVLYIKPFLNNITNKDEAGYLELISKYQIDVVIGGYLSTEQGGNAVLVGEERLYEYNNVQMKQMAEKLSEKTKVYFHSTDYICDLRYGEE